MDMLLQPTQAEVEVVTLVVEVVLVVMAAQV
jgi:hypothetical protein